MQSNDTIFEHTPATAVSPVRDWTRASLLMGVENCAATLRKRLREGDTGSAVTHARVLFRMLRELERRELALPAAMPLAA